MRDFAQLGVRKNEYAQKFNKEVKDLNNKSVKILAARHFLPTPIRDMNFYFCV